MQPGLAPLGFLVDVLLLVCVTERQVKLIWLSLPLGRERSMLFALKKFCLGEGVEVTCPAYKIWK